MDKEDAFWIGNCIGVVALIATIVVLAPIKERERKAYEAKQKAEAAAAAQAQAAQAAKIIQTKNVKPIVRVKPTAANVSISEASENSAKQIDSAGGSQAAGAAASSHQKLRN